MAKKKTQIDEIALDLAPPLILSGGAIGSSILGASLQGSLPAGVSNPLTTTGSTFSNFVGPVATLSAFNITQKQLKKSQKKLKELK